MPKGKRNSPRIDKRQQGQKKLIVDQLRKVPIIQVACEKIGIARATYYRWVCDDQNFAEDVDEAIREGTAFINDMAESQLIGAIKDQNFAAISFWLRNRHRAYANKLQVDSTVKVKQPELPDSAVASIADMLTQIKEQRQLILTSKKSYVIEQPEPKISIDPRDRGAHEDKQTDAPTNGVGES